MTEPTKAQPFDAARLDAYLSDTLPGFTGAVQIRRFSGGQSNPTFLLDSADRKYVLRKKPEGPLLPSAHAVDREHRVMRAIRGSGVPVRGMWFPCDAPGGIGAAF